MFEVAITNSFILCKHHTDLGIQDIKTFRVELAKLLIGDYCSRKHSSRAVPQKTSKKFAQHTFQSVDLTKTTTATTATCTGKNGMKPSGFAGIVGTSCVTTELRKTVFTFTTANMYQ